jgi:hypothetical protein
MFMSRFEMSVFQKLKIYGNKTSFFNKTTQLPMLLWKNEVTLRKKKLEPSIGHAKALLKISGLLKIISYSSGLAKSLELIIISVRNSVRKLRFFRKKCSLWKLFWTLP